MYMYFLNTMEISKFSNRFLLCAVAEYRDKTVSTLQNAKKETKCIFHVLGMTWNLNISTNSSLYFEDTALDHISRVSSLGKTSTDQEISCKCTLKLT
jgi:hypothetical protein